MINSILGKHIDTVTFDNVNNSESILIDPREIKNATKDHFYRWTRANQIDEEKFKEWKQNYALRKNIKVKKYKVLGVEINQAEVIETITMLSLYKAIGQAIILNEILKKLLTKEYKIITRGLNAYIKLRTIL
ncbi:4962_t:CDS:1 [Gigaspora margarita]|uniref:4962_t:CDS:1 n=1 Tax=Gigaspora margarita TaxID=4874 RepID=A0ABN7VK48_GIGMA|nr:4962_t:CDS:1 [Gigaspora margarita]